MSHEFSPNGNHPEREPRVIPQSTYTKVCLDSWQRFENSPDEKDVVIDREKISEFATEIFYSKIVNDELKLPAWRYPGVFPVNDRSLMSQAIFASTQNFAYSIPEEIGETYKTRNPRNPTEILEGAFAMQSRVYNKFKEDDDVTTDKLKEIFRSEESLSVFYAGENEIPHLDLRMETGLDFIAGLDLEYEGSVQNLLTSLIQERHSLKAFHSNTGPGLVDTLIDNFPTAFGGDVQFLKGSPFPFYKRAQLAALELHGRQQNSTQLIMPWITDIDSLGMPIDYEIPKNLRAKGVLVYSEELARHVDNWIEIPKDSEFEVQVRGAGLAAAEELLEGINALCERSGKPLINRVLLDYHLWSVGSELKGSFPHITRTSAY